MGLFNWKKDNDTSKREEEKNKQSVNANQITNNEIHEFDLNIEKILENWEVFHAVREIISNALDERILTNSQDIKIQKIGDAWHIIDYGRGINYHHLTQNENEEKLNNDNLIGRFGVGLKDALATLYRHKIYVSITSKYGVITLLESSKTGFEDIITLHAKIDKTPNDKMLGTDFELRGCTDEDISKAKALFLKFSDENVLEETDYGQVISKHDTNSSIYINGVKVAEESNFLFSYNITSLTRQLKKALNRERTNVGRTAYSDRIKAILLGCKKEIVITQLVDDLQQYNSGLRHDELLWNDIAMHASRKIGDYKKNVVFVTSDTTIKSPSVIDEMKEKGLEPVVVPETLINRIDDYNQGMKEDAIPIMTTNRYIADMAEKKKYIFIEEKQLTQSEKKIYEKTDKILALIGGKPFCVKQIKISETIYESEIFTETVGVWDPIESLIVIKRKQLVNLQSYAGTLIHECMHATSGAGDVSRDFERALTNIIGSIVSKTVM